MLFPLKHRVTLRRMERSATGNRSIAASHGNLPALVSPGLRTFTDREGQERSAAATIYLNASAPFEPAGDYVIEHDGVEYQAVMVERIPNHLTGRLHHFKVICDDVQSVTKRTA